MEKKDRQDTFCLDNEGGYYYIYKKYCEKSGVKFYIRYSNSGTQSSIR